jgi:hypothetical protein
MSENTEQKKQERKKGKSGPITKRNTALKKQSQKVKAKTEQNFPSPFEMYPPEERARIERATEAYMTAWMQNVRASFFPEDFPSALPESDKIIDFAKARATRRKC